MLVLKKDMIVFNIKAKQDPPKREASLEPFGKANEADKEMESLFEQNQANAKPKQERSGSFFGLIRRGVKMVEEKKQQTPKRNTMVVQRKEEPPETVSMDTERHKQSVMTRIYIAQQKLHEINLGEALRDADQDVNDLKFETKNLDQELVMIKIEMAMIKCQIEETLMEQVEL